MCQVERPIAMDTGTMCISQSPTPGIIGPDDIGICLDDSEPGPPPDASQQLVDRIFSAVDSISDLKDAGVAIAVVGAEPIELRGSTHPSGLDTYVVVRLKTTDSRTWWQRWNGVVLNCGGAAISWGGVALAGAAELPSAGASTVGLVLAYSSAGATTAQCGLAIAKETVPSFGTFVDSNGRVFDGIDILLDVVALFGGIPAAITAVRGGSALLKSYKYAALLEELPKGQLLKGLEKLEQAQNDVKYLREVFARALAKGAVSDPVGRKLSNNLLKRALPFITKQIGSEVLQNLSSVISEVMSAMSSSYGGIGPSGGGVVRITIQLYQGSIAGD